MRLRKSPVKVNGYPTVMKTHNYKKLQIVILILLLLFSGTAFSRDDESSNGSDDGQQITASVNPGLNHLLDMVTPGNKTVFINFTFGFNFPGNSMYH